MIKGTTHPKKGGERSSQLLGGVWKGGARNEENALSKQKKIRFYGRKQDEDNSGI